MQLINCEAIVLGVQEYREADKILTLFTLQHGKLKGVAKGARKSMRRFGGVLESFARLHLQLTGVRGLSTVHSADVVSVFPRIRADLAKIGHAGYGCELVEGFLPEGMANARIFRLLAAYLERLDQFPPSESDRRFFEMNLLNILGYCPALEQCASCGTDLLASGGSRFAATPHGLLCSSCGKGGKTVSAKAAALLAKSLRTSRFGTIAFLPAELAEVGGLLNSAIAAHLDRPLKSPDFLRAIAEAPAELDLRM